MTRLGAVFGVVLLALAGCDEIVTTSAPAPGAPASYGSVRER